MRQQAGKSLTERLAAVEDVGAALTRQQHLEGRLVPGPDAQGRVRRRPRVGLGETRAQHAELEPLDAAHPPAAEAGLLSLLSLPSVG